MKIVILGGGTSPERDVSLRSAKAVTTALEGGSFEVVELDPKDGLDSLAQFDTTQTIVLPVLHGSEGEDGVIQAALEKAGLAYLGTDSVNSANCFDKSKTRSILQVAAIPVAEGVTVTAETYSQQSLYAQPHVLKAVGGGSSIGTYIVRDPSQIDQAQIAAVFEVSDTAVLETLVEGVEITVPIFDTTALPVVEIAPPAGGEFDYENKYNGATKELCPAESLSADIQSQAQRLGEQVHEVMGGRHLSRVDMIVQPGGDIVVLEINTMPGMTDQSLYPKSAAVAGMDFPTLVQKFIELVQRDYPILYTETHE